MCHRLSSIPDLIFARYSFSSLTQCMDDTYICNNCNMYVFGGIAIINFHSADTGRVARRSRRATPHIVLFRTFVASTNKSAADAII